jgi:hypothetical protein
MRKKNAAVPVELMLHADGKTGDWIRLSRNRIREGAH